MTFGRDLSRRERQIMEVVHSGGRVTATDLSSIRGAPVIDGGTVYAVGLGGLIVAIDLRSGRRVW